MWGGAERTHRPRILSCRPDQHPVCRSRLDYLVHARRHRTGNLQVIPALAPSFLVDIHFFSSPQPGQQNRRDMPDTRGVTLQTSQGLVSLELYWDHAPKTCENFWQLAKRGYYNGIVFHRIISDFMIQGGDPTGTGRGGSSIYGDKFADEITNQLRFTGAGILAMANSGPNTNGSQFFVTLAPTPHLDRKHTIFGRVSQGMGVIQRMGLVATDADDR